MMSSHYKVVLSCVTYDSYDMNLLKWNSSLTTSVISLPKSNRVFVDKEKYKHELMWGREPRGPVSYISYTNNLAKNREQMKRHMDTNSKVCCPIQKAYSATMVTLLRCW